MDFLSGVIWGIICALAIIVFLVVRRILRTKRRLQNLASRIFNLKVKDPFAAANAMNTPDGATVILGDLMIESSFDAVAINALLDAYGIGQVKDVVDIQSSDLASTLARVGGKNIELIDGSGNLVANDSPVQLVPHSSLAHLSEYLSSKNWSASSLAGFLTETKVHHALSDSGYLVEFPASASQPGYDLLLDRAFFESFQLPFVKDDSLDQVAVPDLGVLQVKNVHNAGDILEHFSRYPDIPAIVPSRLIGLPSLSGFRAKMLALETIGIDAETVHNEAYRQLHDFASGYFGDAIDTGLETNAVKEAVRGYYGHQVPEIFGMPLPVFGMSVTMLIASRRAYQYYKKGDATMAQTSLVVATAVAGATLRGMTAMGTSRLVAVELLGATGTPEIYSNGLSGLKHVFKWDWDLDDLADVGELALVLAVGIAAVKGMNKLWILIKGDPLGNLKEAQVRLSGHLGELRSVLADDKAAHALQRALGWDAFEQQYLMLQSLKSKQQEIRAARKLDTSGKLRRYLLELGVKRQEVRLAELEVVIPSTPVGKYRACREHITEIERQIANDGHLSGLASYYRTRSTDIQRYQSTNLQYLEDVASNGKNQQKNNIKTLGQAFVDNELLVIHMIVTKTVNKFPPELASLDKTLKNITAAKLQLEKAIKSASKERGHNGTLLPLPV